VDIVVMPYHRFAWCGAFWAPRRVICSCKETFLFRFFFASELRIERENSNMPWSEPPAVENGEAFLSLQTGTQVWFDQLLFMLLLLGLTSAFQTGLQANQSRCSPLVSQKQDITTASNIQRDEHRCRAPRGAAAIPVSLRFNFRTPPSTLCTPDLLARATAWPPTCPTSPLDSPTCERAAPL
jgi:hypothetical protein